MAAVDCDGEAGEGAEGVDGQLQGLFVVDRTAYVVVVGVG